MAYKSTVAVNVRQAVTSGAITSLNHSMVIDTNSYFLERVRSYSSITEVNADDAIPKNSSLYRALQNAFPNAGSRSLPIFVGRREASSTSLTFVPADNTEYRFTVRIVDTSDYSEVTADTLITFTSGANAVDLDITDGIEAAITSAGIPTTSMTVASSGSTVELTPVGTSRLIITKVSESLEQSFSSLETAATCFAEIQAENDSDYYYVTTTVRENNFILDLCDAIEATESTDYPKIFRVSSNSNTTLIAKTDPADATDLLGLMQDRELGNCFGEWHDQADEIFPELAACVYYGSFFAGVQNWKFMEACRNPIARHPVIGRKLTTAEQGFIMDRNAAVRSKEMGVSIYKVDESGDVAKGSGAWMDNLTISHWIRLNQKLRVFNALVNKGNAGTPLTFTQGDRNVIRERAESVLVEAVSRKMLSGFDPVVVPSTISFEDQAGRTLKDVTYTGYFAGKINFVIIDGILTYREEV